MQVSDLGLIDKLALLSHAHQQMQVMVNSAASASLGLNIQNRMSNIPKYNMENTNLITFDGESLKRPHT